MKRIPWRSCLTVATLLLHTAALADSNRIVVHLTSAHLKNDRGTYNERNYGIGYRDALRYRAWFWGAGVYRNSINNTSLYAGIGVPLFSRNAVGFNVVVGGITGYQRSGVVPFVLPEIALSLRQDVTVLLHYFPEIESDNLKSDPAISLSVAMAIH